MSVVIYRLNKPSTINEKATKAIGTYKISAYPLLYEIQRSNNFEFVVPGLKNIIRALQQEGEPKLPALLNPPEVLRMSVSAANVPHFELNPIEVRRGNNSVKFAGTPIFLSGSITINDYIGAESKAVLEAWLALSYNVYTEKVGLASDYKKDAYLIEYTPDYQEVRRWVLKGCWVSGLSENPYDSTLNNQRTITVTIQYDKAWIDTTGVV